MTLLEAQCVGTPCIGSDIPGIRAVLKDGLGHIVLPTEEAFAEAMKAAIERRLPPLKNAEVRTSYSRDTMAEFYGTVLARTADAAGRVFATDRTGT